MDRRHVAFMAQLKPGQDRFLFPYRHPLSRQGNSDRDDGACCDVISVFVVQDWREREGGREREVGRKRESERERKREREEERNGLEKREGGPKGRRSVGQTTRSKCQHELSGLNPALGDGRAHV